MKSTLLLNFLALFNGIGYSLLAPIFPSLGKKEGINEALIGWIISTFSLFGFLIAPFCPFLCQKYGRINLLYLSTFGEATCTILYGFLYFINSFYILIISVFIIRIFHGICSGIVIVLVFSLTSSLAKEDELQLSLGNIETALCLGGSCGPLFASFLYYIGGYPCPFIILGLFLFLSVYFTNVISKENIKSEEVKNEEKNPPLMKFIFHKEILMILGAVFIGVLSASFYTPCLTNHLTNNYDLSVSVSSLFFVIPILTYIIALRFLSLISKRIGLYATTSLGLILATFGCLFIYPVAPIPKNIFWVILGFIILGAGEAPLFVPTLVALNKNIKLIDSNLDEMTSNDISSALFSITNNIADFLAPVIGGFISTKLGFMNCCILISFLFFIYLIGFIYFYYNILKDDLYKYFNKEIIIDKNQNISKSFELNKNLRISKYNISFNNIRNKSFSVLSNKNDSLYFSLMK